MYSLGLSFAPVKDVTASLDGYLLRANEVLGGGSKSIGTEVDARLAYKIDKNLTYSVIAGYFSAGKYWEDMYGIDKRNVPAAMHALTLSF